jgi:hypothetical protein
MSNNDELLLIGDLDSPVPTNHDWVLDKIDLALKRSVKEKDVYIALNVAKELYAVGKIAGLGLAKVVYYIQKNWDRYKIEGKFDELVYDYIGVHKHTIERYVKVWGIFDKSLIPDNYLEEIQQKNVANIIPIANALYQGYEISNEAWDKLVDAPNDQAVRKVIREDVKDVEPRGNALQLYIDDKGTIWAFHQNKRSFVGSLELQNDDETIQKAVERIIKNSGMMRQG